MVWTPGNTFVADRWQTMQNQVVHYSCSSLASMCKQGTATFDYRTAAFHGDYNSSILDRCSLLNVCFAQLSATCAGVQNTRIISGLPYAIVIYNLSTCIS